VRGDQLRGTRTKAGRNHHAESERLLRSVWDVPRFGGITDYINGPRAYVNLRDLPGGRVWENRIRSVKTGVAAGATVYGSENFTGPSMRLTADREYATLPEELSGQIESMRIDCPKSAE
jgi:hypothetical protein